MSFGKIIKGYGTLFSSLLSFLAIALACATVGFFVSYPLWLLATKSVVAYTTVTICFFVSATIGFFVKKLIKEYKKSPRKLFISLLRKITVIGGLVLFVFLILNFHKILAFGVMFAVVVVYGILAFGISQGSKR